MALPSEANDLKEMMQADCRINFAIISLRTTLPSFDHEHTIYYALLSNGPSSPRSFNNDWKNRHSFWQRLLWVSFFSTFSWRNLEIFKQLNYKRTSLQCCHWFIADVLVQFCLFCSSIFLLLSFYYCRTLYSKTRKYHPLAVTTL